MHAYTRACMSGCMLVYLCVCMHAGLDERMEEGRVERMDGLTDGHTSCLRLTTIVTLRGKARDSEAEIADSLER